MDYLATIQAPIRQEIDDFTNYFKLQFTSNVELLNRALSYVSESAGKLMRPMLVLLVAKSLGEVTERAFAAASAMELLHSASLLHDDVIDESDKRRGRPSLNIKFNNNIAVLTGDYLFSQALNNAAKTGDIRIIEELARIGKELSSGEVLQVELEQEGTYPLPEAQVDRFMLKAKITYPKREEERDIVRMNLSGAGMPEPNKVISPEDIVKARKVVEDVYMDEKIEKYIVDIIFATREPASYNLEKLQSLIAYGGSPRASISLAKAARAYAFIRRRGYVIPEDVRAVCHDVLRHRIGLTYEAEAENITSEDIITEILNNVIVP